MPLWFGAWGAAKDWGVPPWVIMGEPDTNWNKMKWVMRNNFVAEQMNKKATRDAKEQQKKNARKR